MVRGADPTGDWALSKRRCRWLVTSVRSVKHACRRTYTENRSGLTVLVKLCTLRCARCTGSKLTSGTQSMAQSNSGTQSGDFVLFKRIEIRLQNLPGGVGVELGFAFLAGKADFVEVAVSGLG